MDCFQSNSRSSLNMGFVLRTITKMADKMAATYQFCCCGRSKIVILIIFFQTSYMDCFHRTLVQVWICVLSDEQLLRWSIKMAVAYQFVFMDTTIILYYPISSKFHTWISFIKLSPTFRYGLSRITKMAADMAATCRFSLVDSLT